MSENRTLVDRLRGIYRIPVADGHGPLNGKDTFTRKFTGLPPIQEEAAKRIVELEAENRKLMEANQQLRSKASLGRGWGE